MSAPPYMKLFWGDYHRKTRHLTQAAQHGAYMLLIGEAWQRGGSLPDDDAMLSAWAACAPADWAVMKPVIMGFFSLRRGKWVHDRVREELLAYESTSRKRKEAGRRGGLVSVGAERENPEAIAFHLPTKPEPEPEPLEEDANASIVGLLFDIDPEPDPATPKAKPWLTEPGFNAVWDAATDQMRGRAKSREKAWPEWQKAKRSTSPERILAGMRAYLAGDPDVGRTGGPGLHIWLRDRTFELWGAEGLSAVASARFPGPPQLREWIANATTEGFAASYLDPAGYRAKDRVIEALNGFAAQKIVDECAAVLARAKVTVEVAKPPADNTRSAA